MIDSAEGKAAGAPRVLIVEPGRTALAVLARRIGEAGYRIAAADSAQSAVAELHRLPVDLILAELAMPGTSGVELTRMIRDDAAHRDLPVILIAGRSDRNGAIRALEAGADDVVVKPFHFEVLIARIGRQLARARAVAELRDDNATLDARVITRAIELGEMRERWLRSEAERRRLQELVRGC
jgi:two-component system, OmpR family, phosphate regulon response regulator PhoB